MRGLRWTSVLRMAASVDQTAPVIHAPANEETWAWFQQSSS